MAAGVCDLPPVKRQASHRAHRAPMESVIPAVPINTAALVAKIEAHTAQQCQLVPWWQGASTSHLPSLLLTSRAGSHHMVREIAAEKYKTHSSRSPQVYLATLLPSSERYVVRIDAPCFRPLGSGLTPPSKMRSEVRDTPAKPANCSRTARSPRSNT